MTSWRDMTYSANEKERFRKGRCLTQYIITGSRTNVPLFHILPDPPSSPFCLGILHWHWLRGDRKEPESLSPPFSNADHHPSPATVTRLPEEITMSLTHPMLATIPLAWCVLVGGGLWFSSHPFVWMWLTVGSSSHQEPKKGLLLRASTSPACLLTPQHNPTVSLLATCLPLIPVIWA